MTRREQRGQGHGGRWNELLATKDDDWLELLAVSRPSQRTGKYQPFIT